MAQATESDALKVAGSEISGVEFHSGASGRPSISVVDHLSCNTNGVEGVKTAHQCEGSVQDSDEPPRTLGDNALVDISSWRDYFYKIGAKLGVTPEKEKDTPPKPSKKVIGPGTDSASTTLSTALASLVSAVDASGVLKLAGMPKVPVGSLNASPPQQPAQQPQQPQQPGVLTPGAPRQLPGNHPITQAPTTNPVSQATSNSQVGPGNSPSVNPIGSFGPLGAAPGTVTGNSAFGQQHNKTGVCRQLLVLLSGEKQASGDMRAFKAWKATGLSNEEADRKAGESLALPGAPRRQAARHGANRRGARAKVAGVEPMPRWKSPPSNPISFDAVQQNTYRDLLKSLGMAFDTDGQLYDTFHPPKQAAVPINGRPDNEAVIIDQGVAQGMPVLNTSRGRDGMLSAYSGQRGTPMQAKLIALRELLAMHPQLKLAAVDGEGGYWAKTGERCQHCFALHERGDDGKCNSCGKEHDQKAAGCLSLDDARAARRKVLEHLRSLALPEKVKAANDALPQLLQAKQHSDRKQYEAKHAILRALLAQSPGDFQVDSQLGRFAGLTHNPTNFRIHMPANQVPELQKAADWMNHPVTPFVVKPVIGAGVSLGINEIVRRIAEARAGVAYKPEELKRDRIMALGMGAGLGLGRAATPYVEKALLGS